MESSVQQMDVGATRSSVPNVGQHAMVVTVRLDPSYGSKHDVTKEVVSESPVWGLLDRTSDAFEGALRTKKRAEERVEEEERSLSRLRKNPWTWRAQRCPVLRHKDDGTL